jgi:peptidoglycan hydrolase-like protein with peptidoglycan-binding domain
MPEMTGTTTHRSARAAAALMAALTLASAFAACSGSSTPPPTAASSAATVPVTSDAATATASVATTTAAASTVSTPSTATTTAIAPPPATSEPNQAAVRGTCERTLTAYPVLEPGAKGAAVRALQCFLNDSDYGPVLVDGIYGRQTRAAVARVESGFEGPAPHPGRIDRGMWVLLISRSMGNGTLRQGATGAEVTTLQRALRAAGGTIAVDGVFGSQTAKVVKQFQQANSITVDGVVGDETYFFLKSGGVLPPR